MVVMRLLNVVADMCSMLADDPTVFELMNELDRAHGYAFNGICGSAVYAIEGRVGTEVEVTNSSRSVSCTWDVQALIGRGCPT